MSKSLIKLLLTVDMEKSLLSLLTCYPPIVVSYSDEIDMVSTNLVCNIISKRDDGIIILTEEKCIEKAVHELMLGVVSVLQTKQDNYWMLLNVSLYIHPCIGFASVTVNFKTRVLM